MLDTSIPASVRGWSHLARTSAILALCTFVGHGSAATFEELRDAVRAAAQAARDSLARRQSASAPASSAPSPAPTASGADATPPAPGPRPADPRSGAIFVVDYPPHLRDAPGFPGASDRFEDPHGLCDPSRLRRGAINLPEERDFDAKLRQFPEFQRYVAKLFVFYAWRAPESLAEFPSSSGNRSVDCLARIMARYPEIERVQFEYVTLFNGRPLKKRGAARALLADGAFLDAGKVQAVRRIAADDIVQLDAQLKIGFTEDSIQSAAPAATLAPNPPPSAMVATVPQGQNAGAPIRVGGALGKTFGISDYEIVAIKRDGTVEVRDLPTRQGSLFGPPGEPRKVTGIDQPLWIKSNAANKAPGIGTLSLVKTVDGKWMGWSPRGPLVPVKFTTNFLLTRMQEGGQPPDSQIMDVASGSNGLLWIVYDDGTVFMTSGSGAFPDAPTLQWQRNHRFGDVKKVSAVPWRGGSQHAVLLRNDGTLWANDVRFLMGWLIQAGKGRDPASQSSANPAYAAAQIPGVEGAVDFAVDWTSSGSGKGAIVLKDGGVLALSINRRADSPGAIITTSSLSADVQSVRLPARAVRAAAGAGAVGVLDEFGRVWVWGSDPDMRDLQDKPVPGFRGRKVDPQDVNKPTMIEGLGRAVDIFFGPIHAGALLEDGSVWIWNAAAPIKVFDDVLMPR